MREVKMVQLRLIQTDRGRMGYQDPGICSEAEEWLTTWSRPPLAPAPCSLAHHPAWFSPRHFSLSALLSVDLLVSVAPTLAPSLSCSMTAPMLTTLPQPWHSQRHTVGTLQLLTV